MTGHFEAKKHAYRQTQDGIVVSFVIHPNDVDAKFATASLGTRYMIGFAEIGDDGKPIKELAQARPLTAGTSANGNREGLDSGSTIKERRPFDTLPLSQQAALLCNDAQFRNWLKVNYHDTAIDGPEAAAEVVRRACGVQSRADLNIIPDAAQAWGAIVTSYRASETDRQYADVRR